LCTNLKNLRNKSCSWTAVPVRVLRCAAKATKKFDSRAVSLL
jgi:hypothetical protein